MPATQDSFSAQSNATLTRLYQITSGGTPQNIAGWALRSQWRNADGSLALDLSLASGLFALVNAASGEFQMIVTPAELAGIPPGSLTFDVLAIPPVGAGATPVVYCIIAGTITLVAGATVV